MFKIAEQIKGVIAPDPQELWERGGATMRQIEIDPGRYESVPFFDLEIMKRGTKYTEPMLDELERSIGSKITRTYVTSDGIDRATRLYLPDERSEYFTLSMTTPWTTSIDGMNDDNAEMISKELNVAVALVGAEHSARKYDFPFDAARLPGTVRRSRGISLAKSGQSGQLIVSDMCEEYGLPKTLVKTGESRGAMETDAEYAYAPEYGLLIAYQDKTASCVPDQLFTELAGNESLLRTLGSEALGGAYVAFDSIRKNVVGKFMGTISLNPNFMYSSLVGIGPALASGETGEFIKWLPKYSAGHQVTYKFDGASRPERQRELYAGHPNIAIITLTGSHATLAHTETLRHLIDRVGRFERELILCNGVVADINWANVHLKDDDKYRTMVEV